MSDAVAIGPRVSVLMAVRDGERFVGFAIESILHQTFGDLELIIIDDGSTDGTFDIIRHVSDPRLRVERQANRGLTVSLNRALRLARGGLVARQDADDVSAPSRLARQVEFLDSHAEYAAVGCWMDLVDEDGERISTTPFPCDAGTLAARLPQDNQFCHGSLLMRRDAVLATGGYREAFRYAQDYDLLLRLAERYPLANLGEALYSYRIGQSQLSARVTALQASYAELARRLARERRAGGPDALQRGEDVGKLLVPVTLDPRADPERQLALYYLQAGRAGKARRQLARVLRHNRVEVLLVLALVATFLGDFAVQRLSAWALRRRTT